MVEQKEKLGVTYIFITHDLSLAWVISDRIAVMYLGRIVEIGDTEEVVANPKHPYTKALISVIPVPDPLAKREHVILQGETPNPVDIPPGCRFHPRCPEAIEACKRGRAHRRPHRWQPLRRVHQADVSGRRRRRRPLQPAGEDRGPMTGHRRSLARGGHRGDPRRIARAAGAGRRARRVAGRPGPVPGRRLHRGRGRPRPPSRRCGGRGAGAPPRTLHSGGARPGQVARHGRGAGPDLRAQHGRGARRRRPPHRRRTPGDGARPGARDAPHAQPREPAPGDVALAAR